MKTTRSISVSSFLVCSIAFCAAQDPSRVASIAVEQLKQPVHVNETVKLKVTVTNLSKEQIMIEESRRGAWDAEVYDPLDPTGKDLALPLRKNNSELDPETMVIRSVIPAGSSVTTYVLFEVEPDIFSHPGTYRMVLDKHEWVNNVVIQSNPVTIVVAPK